MKELEASLKMIIPLEGDIIDRRYSDFEGTANFKDLMLSGAKVDFVLRTKSDKLSRYRSGSWRSRDKNPFYKPKHLKPCFEIRYLALEIKSLDF